MEKQRIACLHNQYLNDILSQQELQEWNALLKDTESQYFLTELMDNNWDSMTDNDKIHLRENRSAKIREYISMQPQKKVIKINLRLRITATAAAAVFLVLGIGLFITSRHSDAGQNPGQSLYANDVTPGRQGATLTLASGKKIRLSDATNGEIAKEAGVEITKSANGQLIYEIKSNQGENNKINILSTAKGEVYTVILPDKSKIWLNAASSLKYPSNFAALKDRKVELTGEAYFEISKNKMHPFVVQTGTQQVKVLGTHFNINAYTDEPGTKTTLLEGSVQVNKISDPENSVMLNPGQQSFLDHNRFEVSVADIQSDIAWKNGDFNFNGEDVKSIMRKLSRWYDIEVIYDGAVTKEIYYARISRFKNIKEVLTMLEKAQGVHFKIEGRRIVVMK